VPRHLDSSVSHSHRLYSHRIHSQARVTPRTLCIQLGGLARRGFTYPPTFFFGGDSDVRLGPVYVLAAPVHPCVGAAWWFAAACCVSRGVGGLFRGITSLSRGSLCRTCALARIAPIITSCCATFTHAYPIPIHMHGLHSHPVHSQAL